MVRVYKKTNDKTVGNDREWNYWGVFKTNKIKKYVWYKEVSKDEAEQYESENNLPD